jgi:hypothetical protein
VIKWLKAPLSSAEVLGYLVYVAGFAILIIRGAFHDPWLEAGLILTVIGLGIAGRGQAVRSA